MTNNFTKTTDNYYQILGLSFPSTVDEVKKAYRKLMLKYHPDVTNNPLQIDYFEKVVRAYKILSTTATKEEYDKSIKHSYQPKVQNITKVKPSPKQDDNKKSNFMDKLKFKSIFSKSKNKNNNHKQENQTIDFFKVPNEILDLGLEDLKDRFLHSSNKYVRAEALKGIVLLQEKKAYKLIEQGFEDQSKEVKEVAIRAIEKLNIRQAVFPLSELYKKSGSHLRKVIVNSMASLQIEKANEQLIQYCFDSNEDVQLEALKAVYKYHLYNYLPKIKSLTYHQNREIQEIVKTMLNNNGKE